MFNLFENKSEYQNLFGDQYVPDIKYLPNIKLESETDASYYSAMSIDLNTTKISTKIPSYMDFGGASNMNSFHGNHVNTKYTFETSDGECSPKSIENYEYLNPRNKQQYFAKGNKNPLKVEKRSKNRKTDTISGKTKTRLSTDYGLPKEKDRAKLFNEAFDGLRKRIPSIPASKKLSKIEILRLAICYMSYLKFLTEDSLSSPTTTCDSSLTNSSQNNVSSSDANEENTSENNNITAVTQAGKEEN